MAILNAGNMEDIYQLLSQHNFTLVNETIDHYKCIICQRILINACQAYCGCHYCEKCVDERVRGGATFCPGFTEECKLAKLANIAINYQKNRQISQLVVKCPEEMCCYESQLRNMGDHLRLCGKKNVECPFTDIGCNRGRLAMDRLDEHLHQESYHHSEILTGVIGNLRNELAELKRDREKCDAVIDKLVKSDREKAAMIDSMKEEIELMKMEKRALEQRVDNLASTTAVDIDTRLDDMRRELREAMEQQQHLATQYRIEMTEKIDSIEKCLARKIDADFVWPIDNIVEKRQMDECIDSEYFNGCADPYKMRLSCHNYVDELRICLWVLGDDCDKPLHWPFERNVTITITSQRRLNERKAITNHCTILKPYIFPQWSDAFIFKWTELSDEGLLHSDGLTVQCFIRDG